MQNQATTKLREKSLRLYESLKSPRRYPSQSLTKTLREENKYKSTVSYTKMAPENQSIKLDDNDDSEVKLEEDENSEHSSSHISRHSSPHSATTINKSLNAYLSAMSPSPSKLK
jgi:hypothetical protein